MPIPGEEWGLVNKLEKARAGFKEYDVRETTVTNSMFDAAENTKQAVVETDEDLYAVILRQESDSQSISSNAPTLSRFRCYVFSGPHSEIPFSLGALNYPPNGTPRGNLSVDHYTMEMFPIFTCEDNEISKKLSGKEPGTIVKIRYRNKLNLSEPIITKITSFPRMVPIDNKSTISKFINNDGKSFISSFQKHQQSSLINTNDDQKKYKQQSLAKTKNQSLKLLFPISGGTLGSLPGSRFGPRFSSSGRKGFHKGIDIPAKRNDPILASEKGIVHKVSSGGAHGISISIRHVKNGVVFFTKYSHLLSVNVQENKPVVRGQTIGFVDSTGRSSGDHLHYEIRIGRDSRSKGIEPTVHFDNISG